MNQYKRLNQFPKSYFKELPCNKRLAMKILNDNGRRKKSFESDDELKKYIIKKFSILSIDQLILLIKDDEDIIKYLIKASINLL